MISISRNSWPTMNHINMLYIKLKTLPAEKNNFKCGIFASTPLFDETKWWKQILCKSPKKQDNIKQMLFPYHLYLEYNTNHSKKINFWNLKLAPSSGILCFARLVSNSLHISINNYTRYLWAYLPLLFLFQTYYYSIAFTYNAEIYIHI